MNAPRMRTVAVVGAGYGGLRVLSEACKLIQDKKLNGSIKFLMVDSRPVEKFGRGIAWATDQNANMRANMHSPHIRVDPNTRKTVADILEKDVTSAATASQLFDKREAVGDILESQFKEVLKLAEVLECEVETFQDTVDDIERNGIGYSLTLSKVSEKLSADYVVLALGHIPPTSYPELFHLEGYTRNSWHLNEAALHDFRQADRVAILGLGPTAVDTIIKLRDAGVENISAFSRSGTMQYPRPIPVSCELKILTEKNLIRASKENNGLSLDYLKGMLFSEFFAHGIDWVLVKDAITNSKGHPLDALGIGLADRNNEHSWFGLCGSITDLIPLVWNLMVDSDRDNFRRLHNEISNVIYGMATSHALRMLQELEENNLSIFNNIKSVEFDVDRGEFKIKASQNETNVLERYDRLIDCSGFGTDLTLSETNLIKNLLGRNILIPHPYGGAKVDFETGRLFSQDSERPFQIYTLAGSLNIGVRMVTNGLGHVSRSAQNTTKAIFEHLDPAV